MTFPHPIPDQLVILIARRFHLLAEPTRLRLLDRLRDGEATVQELADELGTSQQNVSKHLAMLADAGVLARRKDGNSRPLPDRRRRRPRPLRADVRLARARAARASPPWSTTSRPTGRLNLQPME